MKAIVTFGFFTILYLCIGCSKTPAEGTDLNLYNRAIAMGFGVTYYKNDSTPLAKSSGSGHSQPFLLTYYDFSIASKNLDGNGKVKAGSKFEEGSLVVKKLLNSNKIIDRYAIMYKQTGHIDADENGWVWGYINADKSIAEKASNKGVACKSCHGQSGNIDFTLQNKFFP